MDKKEKFEAFIAEKSKAAKNLINSAITAVDQNDDGKFDLADVSVLAEVMGNAAKKGAQIMKETAEEKARLYELRTLRPIFTSSLDAADFSMTKLIRVIERPKEYIDSEVCQGSIGFWSNNGGLEIVNIFYDSLNVFGLSFYPYSDCDFFYVDPSDRDRYVALDEYFNYLKVARINELKKIAQDLGAKHFRVTYMEEKTCFSEIKVKANAKAVVKADSELLSTEKQYTKVEIAAEMDFPGHSPNKPVLKYMQRDPSIQTLIEMRMDESSPLIHEKFVLKMSNSSGLKESDAVKIDAVLKGLKLSGNATVASEVKNEARRYLEYEIEF